MLDPVNSRTLSGLPLSVGTSLAFESLFEATSQTIDPDRKIPQYIDINKYNEVWINVGTLFRNMYNAMDRMATKFVLASDAADGLVSEIEFIAEQIKAYSNGRVKAVFYMCDYEDIQKRYSIALLRLPKTDLQLQYSKLYQKTLLLVKRRSATGSMQHIETFNSKFSSATAKALIVTHMATDLINGNYFKSLELLESHTGILKKESEWFTKYYEGKELNMLPFNGMLLSVFGDDHQFRPQAMKARKELLQIAKEQRWNVLTTRVQVLSGIRLLKDHLLRDSLLLQDKY